MKQAEIADRLSAIEAQLARLELALMVRVPAQEIRQAIDDMLETYGLVAQLREVYMTQRDELAALVVIAKELLTEERTHDTTSAEERETIRALLLQLRELGRKHVTGLTDLERALNWRQGDADRRKTSGGGRGDG